MSSPTHLSRNLSLGLLFATAATTVICLYFGLSLDLPFIGLLGLAIFLVLAIRWPEMFLVAAIFAPQWKTLWIFRSVNQIADLTVVMLVCLSVGVLWRLLTHFSGAHPWSIRTLFLRQGWPIAAFFTFVAIVSLTLLYTTAPNYGAFKVGRVLGIGGMFFLVPFVLILTDADFRRFALLFLALAGVTAVQMIAHLEKGPVDPDIDITRIGAGWLMGMAIVLVLFYPFFRTKLAQTMLVLCSLPLLVAGLVASAARGPMVSLALALLVGIAFWLRLGRIRMRTVCIVAVLLLGSATAGYFSVRKAEPGRYAAKASELVHLFTGGKSTGDVAQRLVFYRAALEAIPDNFLFGKGVGSWSVYFWGHDRREYPHNLFLEVGFEEGAVGLAALFLFFAVAGTSIIRMVRASSYHYFVLALMVFYCLGVSMFSGDLDDNRLLWLWFGIALAVCRMFSVRQRYRIESAAPFHGFRNVTSLPATGIASFGRTAMHPPFSQRRSRTCP
jgi:O-antigen ligase